MHSKILYRLITDIKYTVDEFVKKHNIAGKLTYKNYEKKVVIKLGVDVKWPLSMPVQNPGIIPTDQLKILKNAIAAGECQWRRLSVEELNTRKAAYEEKQKSKDGNREHLEHGERSDDPDDDDDDSAGASVGMAMMDTD